MMKERTLRVLEFTKIREQLAGKALTEMGAERCRELVPSCDMAEIQPHFAGVHQEQAFFAVCPYDSDFGSLFGMRGADPGIGGKAV